MTWPTTSRHVRGYGAEWDRTRARILKRDSYLCQCDECKAHHRITEANEVHHIVSKAKAKARNWTDKQIDDDSNLTSLNGECHKRITHAEQGHELKPKRIIGLDGFPVGS